MRNDPHAPSQRQLRVGEEIRHALADVLLRGDFRDPELRDSNITVTEVRVSPDLRNATAFVVPLGQADMGTLLKALKRAAPFLRGHVAKAVKLQFVPNLSFEQDTSFDYAARIDSLLHRRDVARDLDAPQRLDADAADDEQG